VSTIALSAYRVINVAPRASLRIQTNGIPAFPTQDLFVRNADPTVLRSLYLSNDLVRAVLTSNEPSRLRIISAGIKIATKQEGSQRAAAKLKMKQEHAATGGEGGDEVNPGPEGEELEALQKYRVLNDAVSLVLPYMKPEEVIHGDMGVLKVFVRKTYPLAKEFAEPYKEAFEKCGE
jgi:multisite-specific tRNA:(cytosine-C5)-methyltransferase